MTIFWRGKNRDFRPIYGLVSSAFQQWSIGYSTSALSISCDQWILLMTGRLDITPKTTEQSLIVRVGKSEAKATDNKSLD